MPTTTVSTVLSAARTAAAKATGLKRGQKPAPKRGRGAVPRSA